MRTDISANLAAWEADADDYQRRHASQLNRWERLGWGVWDIPEETLGALGPVEGLDALELGCGGGQFGIRVARRGARVTGLDFSRAQLGHAASNARAKGVRFPLVRADAERLPFADASFALVFCDHGATTFTDPRITIPEVSRVLRHGGRLVFNHSTPFLCICRPHRGMPGRTLERPYFGLGRLASEPGSPTEWQLTYGDWIRLFASTGLQVEDLIELRPGPAAGSDSTYRDYVSWEWARDLPAEQIWRLRKAGSGG